MGSQVHTKDSSISNLSAILHLFTNLEQKSDNNRPQQMRRNVLVLPADWVGAMSWPALDGRISTGAGGELFSTTSSKSKNIQQWALIPPSL